MFCFFYGIQKEKVIELTLRDDILKSYHDQLLGGRYGKERTYQTMLYKYFWSGMYSNIMEYVHESCVECQKAKLDNHKKPTPLQPLPVLDVFRRVHMDILGPLKTSSAGYTHILLIVCSFSKHVEIFLLKSTGAKEIARIFYSEYICNTANFSNI